MPSPLPPPEFGSEHSAVLPWAGAALTGVVGFFGARFTAFAQLNKTILDASRGLVEEAQSIHARDGARISELEAEVLRQRGEIAQHIQKLESMERQLRRLQAEIDPV